MNKRNNKSSIISINKELGTESKILEAARQEFAERGLEGARMQSIADRAGVNKALIHYYYRSKEQLFERLLKSMAQSVWDNIKKKVDEQPEDPDLRTVIRTVVESYISGFAANPLMPRVMMRELANGGQNLELIVGSITQVLGDLPAKLMMIMQREYAAGRMRRFEPLHLMMNLMGMCMATFFFQPVAEVLQKKVPMMTAMNFDDAFYKKRIDMIVEMACEGIFTNNKN